MRIGIAGVNGRMGRLLVPAIRATTATIAGGLARTAPPPGIAHVETIAALAAASDLVIDFTHAETALAHADALAAAGTAWVLGTTGLDPAAQTAVAAAAARIPIVQAANFSPGVTLLLALAERMAQALPADPYDAEILEMHHRQKADAPSGTALAIGAAVARGRGQALTRRGPARAAPGEIGFACLRGGQIVGEHSLLFTSAEEQIGFSHRAFDRAVFAAGAVRAAFWLNGRPPGLYSMAQVLNLDAAPGQTRNV